jgi:pimeloyl-ACP methyl ester carboxylesterase
VIAELGDSVRIACADLRGFGWSGWPEDGDFRKERLVDDALATLDALGWERALLAGHDWGALAGYATALRAPERLDGLLALSAPHPWQPVDRLLRNLWRFAYTVPLATPWLGSALMRDRRAAALVLRTAGPRELFSDEEREVYLSVLGGGTAAAATERLYRSLLLDAPTEPGRVGGRRLRVPARLLHGTRDPLGTEMAKGLEDHGDDARVELLEGCGHFLPEERPQIVAEHIRALAA